MPTFGQRVREAPLSTYARHSAVVSLSEEAAQAAAGGEGGGAAATRFQAAVALGAQYGSEMQSAVELAYAQWLPLREDALRAAAAEAIAAMVGVLSPEQARAAVHACVHARPLRADGVVHARAAAAACSSRASCPACAAR